MIGAPTPDAATVSFPLVPSPVITATKWWPYATTTGDPAWDEENGEPINGGPGA
jgi:hypothetical protein